MDEDLFIACNQLATKSRQYFERVAFTPAQKVKAIIPVTGEPLHSPKTKYQLSKLGLAVMAKWKEHI